MSRPRWIPGSFSRPPIVRSARGPRAVQLAYAALALHDGPLLPTDRYAGWADEVRDQVDYRYLAALDVIAADAIARGSHREALTALEGAQQYDPGNSDREAQIAQELQELGHARAAEHLTRRGEHRHPWVDPVE